MHNATILAVKFYGHDTLKTKPFSKAAFYYGITKKLLREIGQNLSDCYKFTRDLTCSSRIEVQNASQEE